MARCDQQRRQQAEEEEEEEEEESRCKWDDDGKEYIWPGLLFFAAVVSVIALIITVLTDRPDPPSPSMRVYGASANMFELDDDDGVTTLRYNLDLNVSVCNESKGFWEKTYLVYHLVATALYGGVPLGYVALVDPGEPLLLLKSDGCSIPTAPPLRPALFRGETTLPAGSQAAALFRREEGEGMFTIDVHLHLWNMHTLPTGDPGVDGRKFYSRSLSYLGNDTSVKLRRPDQSSSSSSSSSAALGRRTGGDDVVVRRLLRS